MAEEHTHHHHHHDYAKANAEHFSGQASTYRSELSLELAKRNAAAIRKNYPFDPNQTEVLDFACGPGLIAFELLPHVKRAVGADLAQGMIDVLNETAKKEGIPSDRLRGIQVAALKGDQSDLNGELFDVVCCVQAYHHFEDPVQMTRALAQRLKPKGRLFIVDFMDDKDLEPFFAERHHHAAAHTVPHKHGFSSEQVIDMLKAAGLQNPQFQNAHTISKAEMKKYQGHEVFGNIFENNLDASLKYFVAFADK